MAAPAMAPASTSDGKCFPEKTRKAPTPAAVPMAPVHTQGIQGESGWLTWKVYPVNTAAAKAPVVCSEKKLLRASPDSRSEAGALEVKAKGRGCSREVFE